MTIKDAIKIVAHRKNYIAFSAEMALEDESRTIDFINLILEQYFECDGNKEQLITSYGKDTLDTIIQYGKTIQAQNESIVMNKCIAEDLNLTNADKTEN